MRGRNAIVTCVGLALLAAGPDALYGRDTRNAVGAKTYRSEPLDQAALREQYVGYICRQAGLPFSLGAGSPVCGEPLDSASWAIFVQAGLGDIDRRCDAYLAWLDDRRRSGRHRQTLNSKAATSAIIASAIAHPPAAMDAVGAALGLGPHRFTRLNRRKLFEVTQAAVHSIVLTRQRKFRESLPARIDGRSAAIHSLRRYLRQCVPWDD